MKKYLGLLAFAGMFGAFAADTVDAEHRVQWLGTARDGCYDDAANWTGGELPANGIDGKYGYVNFQANDVTVRVSQAGCTENSGSIFLGCGAGTHTLTIDTRGTFWEKKGVKAATDWWGVPFAQNLSGTHIFNFEALAKTANNNRIWRFDDALFTWTSTGTTRQDFDLWSGTMTFGDIAGQSANGSLYLGSNGGVVNFNIHPEATLNSSGVFFQRGNAVTHTTFLGGRHSINGFVLKDGNAGAGVTWLHLTNDAEVVSTTWVQLGARASGGTPRDGRSRGVLDMSCSSRMEVMGGYVYLGGANVSDDGLFFNLRNEGDLILRDEAQFIAQGLVYVGCSQCSTGRVDMSGSTVLSTGSIQFGTSSNAVGEVVMRDDAALTCGGVLYMGFAQYAQASMVMKDRTRLSVSPSIGNWMCLAPHANNAFARFEATDDAEIRFHDNSSIEMTMGGTSRAELVLSGRARVLGGTTTIVTNKSAVAGNTSLSLADDARLAVRAVRGGSPVDGSPCMTFTADGGTLAVSGSAAPVAPFLSGCVATLGAGGLTLDTCGLPVVIDQDFTAASGAGSATFTKVGSGSLTVRRNSTHPRTVVEKGTLVFADGVTRFGNTLVVSNGAHLAVSAAGVAVDALVFDGDLLLDVPDTLPLDAAQTLLTLDTALAAEQIDHLAIGNPVGGKAYALALGQDGRSVTVTVSAATASSYTWNAASGAWNVAGNWTPTGLPTHNDDASVASGAAITMDAPGTVHTLDVVVTDPVTVSGDAPLLVQDGVSVVAGGSLTVSAPLRGNDSVALTKRGSGTLTVSGDNVDNMQGNWRLDGGTTTFTSAAALGADSESAGALALSNCTFRYTGEATTVRRPLRLDGEFPCVMDVVGDLTFENFRISRLQGDAGIVKTGAGTLTLDVPSGTTTMSWQQNAPRKTNVDVSGIFSAPNGEVSSWDGAGQLSVLEGRLAIVGKGKAVSTVRQEHHGSVGGSGVAASVSPELYLKDVDFWQGSGNGFHSLVGMGQVAAGADPKVVLDGANFHVNGLYFGHSRASGNAQMVRPVLAITNGTLDVAWYMTVPSDQGGLEPVVRVGEGGLIRRSSSTTAGGMIFTRRIDARFEDGGALEVASPQYLYLGGTANGEMLFANGGKMKVTAFASLNSSGAVAIAFDDGSAEFTENGGCSTTCNPAGVAFRADAGGGELIVGSGKTHFLGIPLRGTGAFTKTGAGTLVLTNDVRVSGTAKPLTYTAMGATTVKVACVGGVEIAEGTLACAAGTTDAASRFSGLGTLSGAFDTFTLAVEPGATDGLTFADLTATKVVVDFGRAADDPVPTRGTAVVAKLADGVSFGDLAWRGVNLGDGKVASFSCADGIVTATFKGTGCAIYIR